MTGDNKPAFNLQTRDREILKLIHDYRFINSSMIAKLIDGSEQGIGRRLQKLFHHNYVNRVKISNNAPVVYALGNQGAVELMLHYGIDRGKIDWTTKNREAGRYYIDHTLMIGRFRYALDLALREMDDIALHFWKPEGELRDEIIYEGDNKKRVRAPLVPDAYFAIRQADRFMPLFLECDRSTMTRERFINKLRGYYHFWKQGIAEQKHGIRAFRVLTITISEQRKENLRIMSKEVDGRGSSLFWFLCEKRYTNDPAGLFAPVWQTPRDDRYRGLIEPPTESPA
jgi:hypothetical protein